MYLFTLVAAILIALVIPIAFFDPQQYSAYASGIQAIGVLIALVLAMLTLGADRHDKQVDRVLILNSEFVTGELQGCRMRLINHLRKHRDGLYIQGVTRDDLLNDPQLSTYDDDSAHTPYDDVYTILMYFERANAAIKTRTVYEPLFHELIMRHALWWDLALPPSSNPMVGRVALGELVSWEHAHEEAHGPRLEYVSSWYANFERDFGRRPGEQHLGSERLQP